MFTFLSFMFTISYQIVSDHIFTYRHIAVREQAFHYISISCSHNHVDIIHINSKSCKAVIDSPISCQAVILKPVSCQYCHIYTYFHKSYHIYVSYHIMYHKSCEKKSYIIYITSMYHIISCIIS